MVACGIFGIPVAKHLSAGGFQDPTSESAQATKLLVNKFGQGDMELLISVTSDDGAQGPAARSVGTDIADQLKAAPYVAQVTSAWTAPAPAAPALISKDGKTGLIVAGITGGESGAQKHAKELTDRFVHDRDDVVVRAGGESMHRDQRVGGRRPAHGGEVRTGRGLGSGHWLACRSSRCDDAAPRAVPASSCARKSSTRRPNCSWKPDRQRQCPSGRSHSGSG